MASILYMLFFLGRGALRSFAPDFSRDRSVSLADQRSLPITRRSKTRDMIDPTEGFALVAEGLGGTRLLLDWLTIGARAPIETIHWTGTIDRDVITSRSDLGRTQKG
jgi:hypothetical protein